MMAFFEENGDNKKRSEVEHRLLCALRLWRVNPNSSVHADRTLFGEICQLVEFYICGCISYGPRNLCGWWSDGIICLDISEPMQDHFRLLGVTWIDSLGVSPFEIDLEIEPKDELFFSKTVFRIGMINVKGEPVVCDRNLSPSRVLEMRPRYNKDWAMAIELTPSLD